MAQAIEGAAATMGASGAGMGDKRWRGWLAVAFGAVMAIALVAPVAAHRTNGTTAWTNANLNTATLTVAGSPTVTVTLPGNAQLFFRQPPATSTLGARGGAAGMFQPTTMATTTQTISLSPTVDGCAMGSNQVCPRGTMTVTFSQPVTNPVLHLSGLGGTGSGANLSARMTLTGSSPAGATLGALSAGAVNLQIVGGSTLSAINNNGSALCSSGSNSAGGCGSVVITGTVTSLTFDVALWINGGSGTGNGDSRDTFDVNFSFREDFSDAPLVNFNNSQAPSHVLGDLRLGTAVDEDNANVVNATASPFPVAATADNQGGVGDNLAGADEDAIVTLPALTTASTSYSLTVPISGASKPGMVCGWIDFNRNNAFAATERACGTFVVGQASVVLDWNSANGNAPTGMTAGNNYVRLRAGYTAAQIQTIDGKGWADSGEVEDYRVTITAPVADLAITKTDGQETYVPGQPITYTLVARNNGPDAVTGARVSDTFPAAITGVTWICGSGTGGGTCGAASGAGNLNNAVANLPSGATVTFTASGTVAAATTGALSNTATITGPATGSPTDPDTTNNSATDTDTRRVTDLSIVKSAAPNPVRAQGQVQFSLVVTNNGPAAINNAIVQDPAAAGLDCTAAGLPAPTCSATPGSQCPPVLTAAGLQAGVAIPTLLNAGVVTIGLTCNVTASGF